MIFKLQIDKDCKEEIIATVHKRTPLINEIENLPKASAGLLQAAILYIDYFEVSFLLYL